MPRFSIAALLVPVALAAPAHAAAATRVEFSKNVLPLGRATDLGKTAATQTMEIGIGLRHPHAAAEAALAQAQQDRSSPDYHHFLTPAQYADRFGVDSATFTRALSWLKSGGATVQVTSREPRLHRGQGDGRPGRPAVRDRDPQLQRAGHALHRQPLRADRAGRRGGAGDHGPEHAGPSPPRPQASGVPQTGELTPQDLWSIYDLPAGNRGSGQSIAVLGEGDSAPTVAALATFEDHHGLPRVPVTVTRAPEVGDFSDTGGSVEWELDTQAATGMAPDVSGVHLYFGQHLIDPDVESALTAWVSDPDGPLQANASFGECETTPANATLENPLLGQFNNDGDYHAMFGSDAPDALEPVAEQTLQQAVLEGRTLFASTGDTGSSCPVLVLGPLGAGNGVANEGVPIVNYPAASPHAVAVGGSVLYSDGGTPKARALEYPWPYTGGGQSFFISEPVFQQGVANVNRPCLSDPDGNPTNTGQTCRGIPDVDALVR